MIKRGILAVAAAALVVGLCSLTGCGGKKDDNGGVPLPHDQSESANGKTVNPTDQSAPGAKGGVKPPPP
jgi:hypothetical protein